jgi:hypothetical protein
MSMAEFLDAATFLDWVRIFLFIFFWPIVFGLIHVVIFRKHPFGNPVKDYRSFKLFIREVQMAEPLPKEGKPRKESPDDYWDGEDIDYDTGEVEANARPAIRHPKNRDRAYSGSTERFHDGGGQDS